MDDVSECRRSITIEPSSIEGDDEEEEDEEEGDDEYEAGEDAPAQADTLGSAPAPRPGGEGLLDALVAGPSGWSRLRWSSWTDPTAEWYWLSRSVYSDFWKAIRPLQCSIVWLSFR